MEEKDLEARNQKENRQAGTQGIQILTFLFHFFSATHLKTVVKYYALNDYNIVKTKQQQPKKKKL